MSNRAEIFEESQIDIKSFLKRIGKKWYLFLISLPLCIAGALGYIYITEPIFRVSASLLIHDNENDRSLGKSEHIDGELTLFKGKSNLQNEIELIRSHSMIKESLLDLDMDVSYHIQGQFKSKERYKDIPYAIDIDREEFQITGVPIYIKILSDREYQISIQEEDYSLHKGSDGSTKNVISSPVNYLGTCEFGAVCSSEYFTFRTYYLDSMQVALEEDEVMYFKIHNLNNLANGMRGKLEISTADEDATIININSEGTIVNKEIDFINHLCEVYIDKKLQEKNQFASGTIDFIERQLASVSDSLKDAETQITIFSESASTLDLESTAATAQAELRQLESKQADIQLRQKYYNNLLQQLNVNTNINTIPAPSAMGINDRILNELILELKQLNQQKVELAYRTNSSNPEVELLNQKIRAAQRSLIENVKSFTQSSEIEAKDLANRVARLRFQVKQLPKSKRLRDQIQRKFTLNEDLYNYLLQKRAEAGIAKAANTADSEVIDPARQVGKGPISPNKGLIMALALMLGLTIPILLIPLSDLFNDKIRSQEMIESKTNTPVIASIARGDVNSSSGLINYTAINSQDVESFRYLRISLDFLAVDQKSKVVGVTSTVPGEGKTFTALNVGSIIASSGQRTVVIGADIRKPRLHKRSEVSNEIGLSTFLANKASLSDIVKTTRLETLDIIPSGPIPPNPLILLESSRMADLVSTLRETYEYIIIDTPPVGFASDYLILSKFMDITLYIIRHGYSKIEFLKEIKNLKQKGNLRNFYVVLNDVKSIRSKYGSYTYGEKASNNGLYRKNNLAKRKSKLK